MRSLYLTIWLTSLLVTAKAQASTCAPQNLAPLAQEIAETMDTVLAHYEHIAPMGREEFPAKEDFLETAREFHILAVLWQMGEQRSLPPESSLRFLLRRIRLESKALLWEHSLGSFLTRINTLDQRIDHLYQVSASCTLEGE